MNAIVQNIRERTCAARAWKRRGLCACLVAFVVFFTIDAVAQGVNQNQLVQALRSGTSVERANAVAQIQQIPVEARGAAVLPALLQELQRLDRLLQVRREAIESGTPPASDHDLAEYVIDVLRTVVDHNTDSRIIPYLLPFVASGTPVMQVLAEFGEQSLPAVLDIATSRTQRPSEVNASLHVLRRMLESGDTVQLSAQSRQRITDVARSRLTGAQAPTVATAAIELALATGDQGLERRVQEIAANGEAVRSFGLSDELSQMVQNRAGAALEKASRSQ